MNQKSILRLSAVVMATVALVAIDIVAARAADNPAPPPCRTGDCCKLCPAGGKSADPKSSNGITVDPKLFSGRVRDAYTVAERNPTLLAQVTCYCGCDKTDGHKSLLDCYKSRHGETCPICTDEALSANRMFAQGMTPEQIQDTLHRRYRLDLGPKH